MIGSEQTGSSLDTCLLQVRENAGSWQNLSGNCFGTTSYSTVWAGNDYEFRLQAADMVGNTAEDSASLTYYGEPPVVSVSASVQGDYIALTWSATDASSLTCLLQVSADGGAWSTVSNDCAGPTTFTEVWADSGYAFRLQASDALGNSANESASLLYNGDPPQVSVEAQTQDDAIVVTWSASDPSASSGQAGSGLDTCALEMRAQGEAWEDLSNDCAGTITPTDVRAGLPYTFRLTATDNAGNVASAGPCVRDRSILCVVQKQGVRSGGLLLIKEVYLTSRPIQKQLELIKDIAAQDDFVA